MKKSLKSTVPKIHTNHISNFFDRFLRDESISGKLIIIATLLSLIVTNSNFSDEFDQFWHSNLTLGLNSWNLSLDLKHWVNEGLMVFFFLVVGLEIKREIVKGELKNKKTVVLPIGAAVGGMIVPAAIYLMFNFNTQDIQGWGIPIATDIAFAVAVLSLLSNRVPTSLKILLLTLAIADDIGAIFVIALYYAEVINYWYLASSLLLATCIFLFKRQLTYRILLLSLVGTMLWVTTHLSGIHASIVGAIMGFMVPISASKNKLSVAEKVEKFFLPITTFFILPIFAFANAGFTINANALTSNQSILLGIFFGLLAGKVIGITLASWLLVKLDVAKLPKGVSWMHIIGIGFIAGIGFTVSIFITELAFSSNQSYLTTAKTGIFMASAISALLGYIVLRISKSNLKD